MRGLCAHRAWHVGGAGVDQLSRTYHMHHHHHRRGQIDATRIGININSIAAFRTATHLWGPLCIMLSNIYSARWE